MPNLNGIKANKCFVDLSEYMVAGRAPYEFDAILNSETGTLYYPNVSTSSCPALLMTFNMALPSGFTISHYYDATDNRFVIDYANNSGSTVSGLIAYMVEI